MNLNRPTISFRLVSVLLAVLLPAVRPSSAATAAGGGENARIDPADPATGWSFGNGPEFPGARGGMAVDKAADPQGRPVLRLDADFSGGGNYVQLGRDLPAVTPETLALRVRAPRGAGTLTLRLVDGTGQCHQFVLRIEPHGEWQQVVFPVARCFEKAGTSAAIEIVRRHESWGGAGDGRWHDPAKGLYILAGRHCFGEAKRGALLVAEARLQTAPAKTDVVKEVRLDDLLREGELDWRFNDGREFPGAKGGTSLVKDEPEDGCHAVRLHGDFTAGGAYVAAERSLDGLDVKAIRLRVRTANATSFNVRLGDGTGQCHQGRGFRLVADDAWHEVVIETDEVVGGEHWGGANDGRWHGDGRYVAILLGKGSSPDLKPEILFSDIRADVVARAAVAGDAYRESFDAAETLPAGWTAAGPAGGVAVIAEEPFDGPRALRLQRAETQLDADVAVTGASFAAAPGPWRVGGAVRSALHSPDNSFAVRLHLEALDAGGRVLERIVLVEQTGRRNWKAFARQAELPRGTAAARFAAAFHKTHGTCDIDALSAAPLAAGGGERLVERIVIAGAALGNLFLPEEPLAFTLDVQSLRPLPVAGRRAVVTVRDYWGAELLAPVTVAVERAGLADRRFRHVGPLTLPAGGIEIGKYHELHVAVPLADHADGEEYCGFARLPPAESRRHPPARIPFTIRNWDSRIPVYFKLAGRLGHRTIGLWGDSGIDAVLAQGDAWYCNSRAAEVERHGWKNITEEQLAKETADFVRRHGERGMAFIGQGNEPDERPEGIAEKVRAYRIVHEAVKSVRPGLPVVATSVPPLESFFAAGYHNYCDIFDFHVYETYENVRQAIRKYKELMRRHGVDKPVWCTELGLNSQGQTRLAVAQEVVKKITAFFAEGGANVSWFTIMYPDPDGKARGTAGDAHNVFDCRYNQYNPRLDAIMYYNMINGIAVKRFADEARHADGVQTFLFRDEEGECLQVLWHENGRVDRAIPLPGVDVARLVRIDGSDAALVPREGAVTLGLSEEPLLLRYRGPEARLARALPPPALTVPEQPLTIVKGRSRAIRLAGPGLRATEIAALVPPRWTAVTAQDGPDGACCVVTAPADTAARAGRVMLRRRSGTGDAVCAEIALSLTVTGAIDAEVLAAPRGAEGEPGLRLRLTNNDTRPREASWNVELTGGWAMEGGRFRLGAGNPPDAYLRGESEGRAMIGAGETREARLSLARGAPQTLYRLRVDVRDDAGRRLTRERYLGGCAAAVRAAAAPVIDGRLDDAVWTLAPPERIDGPEAAFRFREGAPWRGAEDLSATWRTAWDEEHLYFAVEVADDVHCAPFADAALWNQDGLQFLFDPARTREEKPGKYDYSVGAGIKGPQAWCHLAAHAGVREGEAPDIRVAVAELPGSAGGRIYELAIPWRRLAPFVPAPGANLGMNLIVNEADGQGRIGFSGWFSGAHSKELDQVGDLVLGE